MFGRFASMASRLTGPSAGGGRAPGSYPIVPAARLHQLFGAPRQPHPTSDKLQADVWAPPYRGPLELDRYGGETADMRAKYRVQYRESPITRAAVRGKADALSCLEVTVLSGDDGDARACMAAEWLDWTCQRSPRGWRGIIDSVYTPASIDGFSLCEKKLELTRWKGRVCWGLGHVRSLDSALLRIQLDVYRNVVGIVSLVRGIEYYSPDDVILHAHNPLFANPFGQSDLRATTRAANIIEDVYKVWYIALKVYGLPYMTGKAKPTNKKAMAAALASLREGGYAVTDVDESVDVVNLAAAASTDGFERMVHTQREDILFGIRGAALPFLEGDGGADSHGDTGVQKAASDAGEYASALDVADTLNRQLVPWLVGPNFGYDVEMPRVKLGGTNWKETKDLLDIITTAQQAGIKVGARWAATITGIGPPDDDADALVSAEQKQAQQQQAQQPGAPPAPGGGGAPGRPPAPAPPAAPPPDAPPAGMSAGVATFSAGAGGPAVDVAGVVDELLSEALG